MLLFNIIFSLCLASFGGVVAFRLPYNESIIWGHSHCDHCLHNLKWYQMIPILSYIALRGRCAYCHSKIKPSIFIIEVIGLIAALESTWQTFYNPYALLFLILTVAVGALTDFCFMSVWPLTFIPAVIIFDMAAIEFTTMATLDNICLDTNLNFLLMKQKMGFGDIEIMLLIALLFGLHQTLKIILIATILALAFILFKNIYQKQIHIIPFVPFLLLALLIYAAVIII